MQPMLSTSELSNLFRLRIKHTIPIPVRVSVEASTDGAQLKLLAKNIEPMENVIQKTPGLGLRVFIDNKTAAKNIKEQLDVSLSNKKNKEGPVELIVICSELEKDVRIRLEKAYRVDHLLSKAIKLVPGVVDTEIF